MVAIAIMGILASLLLGAASVAGETARDARTKSLVSRLHTLLMERYDGYRTQRVELKPYVDGPAFRAQLAGWCGFAEITNTNSNGYPINDPRVAAFARLAGLREVMKLEMPDRWSDLYLGQVQPLTQIPTVVGRSGYLLERTPSLYEVYARAYNSLIGRINTETNLANTQAEIDANQSAECLYLIVMNATGDGEARGMFKTTDIGDVDGDGAPEFVDGWGHPIEFLRWAPGFDSDAQLSVASLVRLEQRATGGGVAAVADAILADHDPYDLFRVDTPNLNNFNASDSYVGARGWRLVPLVVSRGGDEEMGLRFLGDTGFRPVLDPYDDVSSANGAQSFGESIDDETSADNITNHNVGSLSRKR